MNIGVIAMLLGSAALKVGDRAPDFTLPDTDGKPGRRCPGSSCRAP